MTAVSIADRCRSDRHLEIDGIEVTAPEGTTIYAAAKAAGVDIPVLCHSERYDRSVSVGCAW